MSRHGRWWYCHWHIYCNLVSSLAAEDAAIFHGNTSTSGFKKRYWIYCPTGGSRTSPTLTLSGNGPFHHLLFWFSFCICTSTANVCCFRSYQVNLDVNPSSDWFWPHECFTLFYFCCSSDENSLATDESRLSQQKVTFSDPLHPHFPIPNISFICPSFHLSNRKSWQNHSGWCEIAA